MNLQKVGFAATSIAVLLLLGSLVLGLTGRGSSEIIEAAMAGSSRIAGMDRIRVEVLNGAGVPGLAGRVTERLRDQGFDVVYYGNATGSLARDSTTILDRNGNEAAIQALADELDLDRIETAIDTSLYLEATLVIGADWPTSDNQ